MIDWTEVEGVETEGSVCLGVATSLLVAVVEVGAMAMAMDAVLAHLVGGGLAISSSFYMCCTLVNIPGLRTGIHSWSQYGLFGTAVAPPVLVFQLTPQAWK